MMLRILECVMALNCVMEPEPSIVQSSYNVVFKKNFCLCQRGYLITQTAMVGKRFCYLQLRLLPI